MCCLLAAYGRTHAPNVTWKDVSPSLPLSGTHITGEHGPTWSQIALFLKCHSAVSLPEIVHESREYVPYSLPTSVPIETHAKNEKKKNQQNSMPETYTDTHFTQYMYVSLKPSMLVIFKYAREACGKFFCKANYLLQYA